MSWRMQWILFTFYLFLMSWRVQRRPFAFDFFISRGMERNAFFFLLNRWFFGWPLTFELFFISLRLFAIDIVDNYLLFSFLRLTFIRLLFEGWFVGGTFFIFGLLFYNNSFFCYLLFHLVSFLVHLFYFLFIFILFFFQLVLHLFLLIILLVLVELRITKTSIRLSLSSLILQTQKRVVKLVII